jgi:hypothetical protein
MKHAAPTREWKPVRVYGAPQRQGFVAAFFFNLCLLIACVAAASAFLIVERDNLYAFGPDQSSARAIAAQVERLNGELIQVDFDRQRQWDDLVAMEVMSEDVRAARGFLLSVRSMLPGGATQALNLPAGASDSEIETAALTLLTPGTRERYQLLARNAGAASDSPPPEEDPHNFELMARALLEQPETDALQFVLSGLRLGLAGEISPRAAHGAAALLGATRRDDYPLGLEAEVRDLLSDTAPVAAFRAAALDAGRRDPGAYANAAAAFAEVADPRAASRTMAVLEQIGAMSEAASHEGAVALLTHANSLADLPRLSVVAQGAGDRAAAAAKRLQRDGRLLAAARGQLTFTRNLAGAMALAVLAMLGLAGIAGREIYLLGRALLSRWRTRDGHDEDLNDDLVTIHTESWRTL